MANKNESRCLSCGEIFTADVRNRGRQKYCGKPECQRASKAASQRRWLSEPHNRHYFRDAENAARVRRWQQAHPGYWRNTTRSRRRTLRETLPSKALIPQRKSHGPPDHPAHVQHPVRIAALGPAQVAPEGEAAHAPGAPRRAVRRGHQILRAGYSAARRDRDH